MSKYCIFEYMYRDAGNWKTFGTLLMLGDCLGLDPVVRTCCDDTDLFVAEQIGVPPLQEQHWKDCGDGPSELDHAYHEFMGLRPATRQEIEAMPVSGDLNALLARIEGATGRWDVKLSPCFML